MTVTIVPEQNPAGEAHLEPFLTELVNESLNSYAYSNAVFLCERLHAASPTEVRVRSLAHPQRPSAGTRSIRYNSVGEVHRARSRRVGSTPGAVAARRRQNYSQPSPPDHHPPPT